MLSVFLIAYAFIAATWLAGFRPVGAAIWYAQTLISVAAILGGLLVRERMRGATRALPAPQGYRVAWRSVRTRRLAIGQYLHIAAVFPLYVACFTAWKCWLDERIPFTWDARLAELGRLLHGGRYPWQLIQPVFSEPLASHLLVFVYAYGWTLAFHAVTAWAALTRQTRFLLAMVLAWPVCGLGMAALMMSAGPAFYGNVVSMTHNPYAALMTYLSNIGSPAEYWQRYLWDGYQAQATRTGAGISAMPSMHLVMATLYACAVWSCGRRWRIAGITFVAVMELGSVHSGWHYALDGYVGIVAALGIWWATGRILDARTTAAISSERSEVRLHPAA